MKTPAFRCLALAGIGCLALAGLPGLASAIDPFAGPVTRAQKTVSLARYNLATPQGVAQARERIALEARRLCRSLGDTRRIDDREIHAACVAEAYADALQQLDRQVAAVRAAEVAAD
jgi:UrcA family protein